MVALRTVVKRLVSDWLIVLAALTTVTLATVLLAAGPIYADAVTISALQRSVTDAPAAESGLRVDVRVFADFYETTDETVRDLVADALAVTGAEIVAHIEADSYGLTRQPETELTELVSFQSLEDVESMATLIEGRWPGAGSEVVEVAMSEATATAMGIVVGEELEVVSRRAADEERTVAVVGVFELDDASDPYWFDDPLALQGQIDSATFRTFGPLLIPSETMFSTFTIGRVNASWRVLPEFSELSVAEVDVLRDEVSRLQARLDTALQQAVDTDEAGASEFTVRTGLGSLLATMDRSLSVTRASVLALLIQLSILAGYALVLMAGLLSDTRRSETVLLRSRGTSPRQILLTSLVEGTLVALPAVLAGPVLATVLLRLLNRVGPLAAIDLTIDPMSTAESYLLATIAGLLSIVALAWPSYKSARSFGSNDRRQGRQRTRVATQRVGVDVALLLLAVIVFWQLQSLSSQVSSRVGGQFGVDPLLVVAPALGLLAGAVLALRVVPLLARAAERIASASRATVNALASWQVARRPARYARSALLLVMAIGIGFFAASYATTWTTSQRDQAAHLIGADIIVTPDRSVGRSVPDLFLAPAHEALSGVTVSMPVNKLLGQLARDGGLGQFTILDAKKAVAVVEIRQDQSPDFAQLMEELVAGRPELATLNIPGEPVAIRLRFAAFEAIPEDQEQCGPEDIGEETCFDARVRLVIQDGNDMLHRVDMGKIPVNEGMVELDAPLFVEAADGTRLLPRYPLRVVNIELESQLAVVAPRVVELAFGGISAVQSDGTTSAVLETMDWADWELAFTRVVGATVSPSIEIATPEQDGELPMTIQIGAGFDVAPSYFSLRPQGSGLPPTLPVVVSETLPSSAFVDVGDEIRMPPLRIDNATGVIVGTVGGFPTADADLGETFILDLPTYQMMSYEPGARLPPVESYWLSTDRPDDDIVAELAAPPLSTFRLGSLQGTIDDLVADPVALGTIGALTVGFVAAAVFAAVGFAVSATVSARERLVEFALLRALGLSPRQLGAWLLVEQGLLVVVSLGLGTLVGVVLTATILPLVTLTQDGAAAVPDVLVEYPWAAVAGLEIAVVGVLAVIVTAMVILLRRVGLGSLLRMGED